MSRICDFCSKGYQKGNLVPRGIGDRVTKRTITHRKANLRVKHFLFEGKKVKVRICSSCLKRLKFVDKKTAEAKVKAAAVVAAN